MDEKENVELVKVEGGEVHEADVNGINIAEDVVATIAGKAASEVKGVYGMNGGLTEMFSKKLTKGVKVQIDDKNATIDLYIIVEYGSRIPDIAWEIQNKVKAQVENMTGLKVLEVNIHVQGVNLPKDEKGKDANKEETQE